MKDKYIAVVLVAFFVMLFGSLAVGALSESGECHGHIQASTDFSAFICKNGESSIKEVNGKTYYICTCKESK